MNAYDVDEITQDYSEQVFRVLKLRPIYAVTHIDRYFTYYLILKELYAFEQYEEIQAISSQIKSGENIHRIFARVVDNDETTILNIFKGEIEYYKEADFTSIFFSF